MEALVFPGAGSTRMTNRRVCSPSPGQQGVWLGRGQAHRHRHRRGLGAVAAAGAGTSASSDLSPSPLPRPTSSPGASREEAPETVAVAVAAGFSGLHHVGLLCQDLQRSLDFYCGLLGMEVNDARPDHKLPYAGKWLWAGSGMLHLMELPSPDPVTGRPQHGGHDRHACIEVQDMEPLRAALDKAGIPYTASKSGRPAIFCRDPDGNALEFAVF